jgi:hypothetical protein
MGQGGQGQTWRTRNYEKFTPQVNLEALLVELTNFSVKVLV